ncbi:MAG: hypothetical protein RIR70_2089 [Pseudomonadota bacterium]|jgi:plasmid stabilization system protein ParE
MSGPKLTLLQAAENELRRSADHYRNVAGTLIAEAFLNKFEESLALIQDNPAVGRPISKPGKNLRLLNVRRFPFSVIYRAREDEIEVVAIAHHRRRPGFWRGR